MSAQPTRLTKERANALLDFVDRGLADERDSLSQLFGLRFDQNGKLDLEENSFELFEPGELDELRERLDLMERANAAAIIIQRRYT